LHSLRPIIKVSMTDRFAIEALSNWAQCGHLSIEHSGKDVPAITWYAYKRNDIESILKRILPYLITKHRQAELLYEFVSKSSRKGSGYSLRDFEILDRLSYLNTRGIEGLLKYGEGYKKYGGSI
jgi:hypothetical protein